MAGFYDLSEAERAELTAQAIATGGAVMERWRNLPRAESEQWNPRAAAAAAWLTEEAGVLDLGCGSMSLERSLAEGVVYYPSDVVARDHRTLVVDYNREAPPITPATAFACLGVLEYLHDPGTLLAALADHYAVGVVSYCTTDSPQPLEPRRAHAWVNDYGRAGLERLFASSGWTIQAFAQLDEIQGLWRLTKRSA